MVARISALGLLGLVAFAPACDSGTIFGAVSGDASSDAGDGIDAATCQERIQAIMNRVSALAQKAGSGCTTDDDCMFVGVEVLPCFEGCPMSLLKTKAGEFGAALAPLSASCPQGCKLSASCAGGTVACREGYCAADFSGTTEPDGASPTCPGPAPTEADLNQPDGAPGWNPPKARQTTACATSDLSMLAANLVNPSLSKWDELVTGLPTSCAQCILSRETDANWQLIVADATGANGFVNWGACYADAPQGSAACWQADQYLNFCTDISCNGCSTQGDYDACVGSKTVTNACDGAFSPDVQSACPQAYAQELDDQCGQLVNAAAIVCGDGTLPDGGKIAD